jgi:hypothetical protein
MTTPPAKPAVPVAAPEHAARAAAPARRTWRGAAACAALLAAGLVFAQNATLTATPSSVKAAYLYKLPAYVEWPEARFERDDSPLIVGVLGADDVAEALAALTAGRTVNGRALVVRRLQFGDELAGLHVVFVGNADRARFDAIDAAAAAQSILTVADENTSTERSVIDFVIVNDRLRFEVHLDAAERNGLRLHSGLLDVAARVHGRRR